MSSAPLGRVVGGLLIPLGLVFSWLAHSMLSSGAPTLRLFVVGPALALVGVALAAFPGGDQTLAQTIERRVAGAQWVSHAPVAHKAAWLVALVAGFLVSARWFGLK
jgi:hypothetical protein